jgi:LPS-assembly protein
MIRQLCHIGPLLLCVCAFSVPVLADSAAAQDWRVTSKPGQCLGEYVDGSTNVSPTKLADNAPPITASSNSAVHIKGDSTTLTGAVSVQQGSQLLSGDYFTMDAKTEHYTVKGNVRLRQKGLLLQGARVEGNFNTGTAAIETASFLLHDSRLRGTATSLRKDEQGTLTIADGDFTTCEPGSNAWAIRGKEIKLIKAQGYGIARHATLRIKDVPVAYSPYFRFPIDDSRQSGFLWPSIGHDSDGGTEVAIPYYFNLRPNLDATYTPRSVWKRGLVHEGELRHLNNYGTNLLAGTFLASDDEYNEQEQITSNSISDFDRQDRWLAHFSHQGRAGPWSSSVYYTSVSDIDYFDDLGGFTNTDSSFSNALDNTKEPALLRAGTISYDRIAWRSTLELRSFQKLTPTKSNQYEILPRLTVSGSKSFGRIKSSALLQATVFDSPSEIEPEGSRIVADLSSSAPFHNSWGYVTPGLRYIHRNYRLDNQSPGTRNDTTVNTAIASLDMGLTFERHTSVLNKGFYQTLEPRLYYLYAEEKFQDDLPVFDSALITPSYDNLFRQNRYAGYDRIGDAKQVALGVTTRYLDATTGAQQLAISVGQIFYMENRTVNETEFHGNNPFDDASPVFISLTAQAKNLSLRASYEHDTEHNRSNRGSIALRYISDKHVVFNVGYSMVAKLQQRTPRNREETDLSFRWPLGESNTWSLVGRWNYGWDEGQTIESLFGVEYNDCCWRTRVVFRRNLERPRTVRISQPGSATLFSQDRRADSGIYFEFQLKGLASLGGRLDNWLHNSIPGYNPGR